MKQRFKLYRFIIPALLFLNSGLMAQQTGGALLVINGGPSSNVCWNADVEVRLTRPNPGFSFESVNFYIGKVGTLVPCQISNANQALTQTSVTTKLRMNSAPEFSMNCNDKQGDGAYFARFEFLDNNGNVVGLFHSPSLNVSFAKPAFTLNGSASTDRFLKVYDCSGVKLGQASPFCGNQFRLALMEMTSNLSASIGPVLERDLNAAEVNTFINGTFDLKAYGSAGVNGNTITFQNDKYYKIIVIANPGWQTIEKYFQFSTKTSDLIMQDNATDFGMEPTEQWQNIYSSNDLWNRYSTSSYATIHQLPDMISVAGNTNKMHARITNKGCSSSASADLQFYWTRARTDELWPLHWIHDNPDNYLVDATNPGNQVPGGSEITISSPVNLVYTTNSSPLSIPGIPANATHELHASTPGGQDWFPPNPLWYNATNGQMSFVGNHPVICLLARLSSASDPISFEPPPGQNTPIDPYVRKNNNVVTRNTALINNAQFLVVNPATGNRHYGWHTVLVNNGRGTTQDVDLTFTLLDDPLLFSQFQLNGRIYIGMDDDLWNIWNWGGLQGTGFIVSQPGVIEVTGPVVTLHNVNLSPEAEYNFGVMVEYNASQAGMPSALTMTWQLQQRFIGAEDPGSAVNFTANVYDIAPPVIIGEVHTGVSDKAGNISGNVMVYPNPFGNTLHVAFVLKQESEVSIRITDIQGKEVSMIADRKKLTAGNYEQNVNTALLSEGSYFLELTIDGEKTIRKIVTAGNK